MDITHVAGQDIGVLPLLADGVSDGVYTRPRPAPTRERVRAARPPRVRPPGPQLGARPRQTRPARDLCAPPETCVRPLPDGPTRQVGTQPPELPADE
jgi:hypothetical protein